MYDISSLILYKDILHIANDDYCVVSYFDVLYIA